MYAWIWRHLPGPAPVRATLAVFMLLAVVVVLFGWVFPWLEPRLPFTEVTVDARSFSTDLSTGGDEVTSM